MENNKVVHDYLESYFMWMQYVEKNPGLFAGIKFPITYGKWANTLKNRGHQICPICKQVGAYSFNIDGVEHEYKCLCNVASWTYRQDQMTERWKDPYEYTPWNAVTPTSKFGGINDKKPNEIIEATATALHELEEFTRGKMGWHILRGTFGSGKSTMLKMVATKLAPIATYVTAGNLKNRFRDASVGEDNSAGLSDLIEAFSKVRILLIDDIGMEYDGSGFTTKTLRNIIDNRMAFPFKFPTIATTNMRLNESDLLGGKNPDDTRAIVSRFLDPRYSHVHYIQQGDARRVGYETIMKGGL